MTLCDIFLPYQLDFFKNQKKRKIWIASRQIGKSFTVAGILCYKALSKSNGLSLCVSVNSRSASEIVRKCQQFAEAIKKLTDGNIDYTASYDGIKFSNGSRVMSLPSTSDSLRGFSSQCVVLDEAAFIWHLDDILQAIGPTLTRDKDAELILTSTPAGKNGPFYDIYCKALDSEEWYVQSTDIWQARDRGLQVDIDSLKTLCPDPDVFKQEYECAFSNEFGAMLDPDMLEFYDEEVKKWDGIYFSADIGRTHDKTSVVVTKLVKDMLYVDDILTLSKCEYQEQLAKFKALDDKFHFTAGYIDQGGIGSAVSEFANKQISSRIKGFTFTGSNKTPAYEALRDKVFQHKLKFNKKFADLVKEDIRNVQRIVTENGQVKYVAGRDDNGHSDFVSSLVLNVQATKDFPVRASMPALHPFNSAFGSRQWHF